MGGLWISPTDQQIAAGTPGKLHGEKTFRLREQVREETRCYWKHPGTPSPPLCPSRPLSPSCTDLIFSAMLHLESQMPLSPWRPSFGTASGDCVNTCSSYHFSLGLSAGATGPGWPHLRQNRTENYYTGGFFFFLDNSFLNGHGYLGEC